MASDIEEALRQGLGHVLDKLQYGNTGMVCVAIVTTLLFWMVYRAGHTDGYEAGFAKGKAKETETSDE